MRKVLFFLIRAYQIIFSPFVHPLFRSSCAFFPSCSEYGLVAIKKHGVFKGGALAFLRVLRCYPFRKPSYDLEI